MCSGYVYGGSVWPCAAWRREVTLQPCSRAAGSLQSVDGIRRAHGFPVPVLLVFYELEPLHLFWDISETVCTWFPPSQLLL